MAGPFTLVVFVALSDAADPSTSALLRVAQDGLGQATTTLRVLATPALSDADLLENLPAPKPTAVAEVTWAEPQHLHATLHVHVEGASRWVDRQITFEAVDSPSERGRTLGFALLSMLPERQEEPEPPQPPPPPPPPPTHIKPPPDVLPPRIPLPPLTDPVTPKGAFEVTGVASMGVGGYAGGIGASLSGRWSFARGWAVRLAGGARVGEIAPAAASTQAIFGAAGIAWEAPWRAGPLSVGARIDALVLRQELAHLDGDDPSPVRQALWLMGADSLLEASFAFASSSGVFLAGGSEYAFGSSNVYLEGKQVAVVAPIRLVAEIGARARF